MMMMIMMIMMMIIMMMMIMMMMMMHLKFSFRPNIFVIYKFHSYHNTIP